MKLITEVHCSQLSRPMTCLGSVEFHEQTEPGEAAKEGTAAGELLEMRLTGQVAFPKYYGIAKNGVSFDDDMSFYTSPIAEEILSNNQDGVLCETKIDWTTRSGIVVAGKYDASFIRGGKLYIDDLKYGWNIVEVKENWQLLGYAIGEVIRRNIAFDRIVMRIHQPRPHHEDGPTREWEISYAELLGYKEQIEARMDQLVQNNRELVTSSKCKYCLGASYRCPAFNRSFYAGVEVVLSEFKQDSIDEKEISQQLMLLDRVNEIMKIKTSSLEQLAIDRIKNGKIIPGYMTKDSYGDRTWKKDVSPLVIETLTGKKIVEQKMMSPAQAEKLGVSKDLIKGFVDRFFKGQKLVRGDSSKLAAKAFGD